MTKYYAIIDHSSNPQTIVVLTSGRDLKERFLRAVKEHYDADRVAIKRLFTEGEVIRTGASDLVVTVSNDGLNSDVKLTAEQTWLY